MQALVKNLVAYLYEHADRLKCIMLLMNGLVERSKGSEAASCSTKYLLRFPYAVYIRQSVRTTIVGSLGSRQRLDVSGATPVPSAQKKRVQMATRESRLAHFAPLRPEDRFAL